MILALAVGGALAAQHPAVSRRAQACAILENARRHWNVIGLTAAYVDRSGREVEFALGRDALGEPLQPGAKFLSGSIGKTFVAALALDLERRHRLVLDRPARELLAGKAWFPGLPNSREFTLRQLLTHTSGLPSHVADKGFQRAISERIRACPACVFPPDEAIAYVDGKKPLYAPGKGWAYSETGYLVAGRAIETATSSSYYALLRKLILRPLGLNEIVPSDRNLIPGLVAGEISLSDNYFGMHPPVTFAGGHLRYNPAFEWTGGGVAASSRGLARWARLLYTGQAFRGPYLRELLSGVPTEDGRRYGLGVAIGRIEGRTVYGHTGSIPGYSSAMFFFPGSREAVAVQAPQDVDSDGFSVSVSAAALRAGGAFRPELANQNIRCS